MNEPLIDRKTCLKIMSLFSQGTAIKEAIVSLCPAVSGIADPFVPFLEMVGLYGLTKEWAAAKEVAATVKNTLDGVKLGTAERSYDVIDQQGQDLKKLAELEKGLLQDESVNLYYRVGLIHTLFKYSFLSIEECLGKVGGITPEEYYTALRTHEVLSDSYGEALLAREHYVVSKATENRLVLMNNVLSALMTQTVPYKETEVGQVTYETALTDLAGNELGTRKVTQTRVKEKTLQPSPAVLRLALTMLGVIKDAGEEVSPDTVVMLENLSPSEINKRREELRKKYNIEVDGGD